MINTMKRFLGAISLFFLFCPQGNVLGNNGGVDTLSNTSIYLQLKGTGFFDNLEFFNNIEKGYTLTGFNLEPRIGLSFNAKTNVSGGFHLLYFAGEKKPTTFIPVLTLSTSLGKNLLMNLGTIDGANAHGLPQAIFKHEREFVNQPETGLQFLFDHKYLKSDLWLNWEQFIFPGDTLQEEFTVGFSGLIKLLSNELQMSIPLYAIAVHRGGQINSSSSTVSTLANFGGGVNFSEATPRQGRIGIEMLLFLSRDLSPNPSSLYKKGWAAYPQVYFQGNIIKLSLGYWRASEMILPRGQQIFGSLSTISPVYDMPQRELLTFDINFRKEVAKGFSLSAGTQLYYDTKSQLLDYRFGVRATFNETIQLIK
jgi:hypothetical protein